MYVRDDELQKVKDMFFNKILVEILKTKINRHKIFWIGRSETEDRAIRLGIEFEGGRRYFYNWEDFRGDARISDYEVMSSRDADLLEKEIKDNLGK